ncbi:MAG: ribonuclease D [Alphaproteobacteria bacterium]|jgi:ribonuclease D
METRVITTTQDLVSFVATLADEQFITVDTEFIRERTYYPQLCLLQIASSKEAVAIDPLAEAMDLSPLYPVLVRPELVKVFHAAGQDVEIFYKLTGAVPTPLYDTQIAGMVCGFGESSSYETLVRELVGAKLDKASRFTDWARRPLSERQLVYALDDVIHLRKIYELMQAKITANSRAEWIGEEMREQFEESRFRIDTANCWKRLKVKSRDAFYLNMLRAAAAWREEMAMQRNVPRQRILRDEVVLQLAAISPQSPEEMAEVRGLGNQLSRDWQALLIERLHAARIAPKETFPTPPPRHHGLNPAQDTCMDLLRMLLKQKCDEAGVVPRLVAEREELEALVKGEVPLADSHVMHGWRYQVFGQYAENLLRGKLTAAVDHGRHGYALTWKQVA